MNKSSLWRTHCSSCQAETLHSAWHCIHCKTASVKWKPIRLGMQDLDVLTTGKQHRKKHHAST